MLDLVQGLTHNRAARDGTCHMAESMAPTATIADLTLPPLLRSVPLAASADPFAEACARAAELSEGALLWAQTAERADAALLLHPDTPRAEALKVAYVVTLGIGDALGALVPPVVPVMFGWPDRIEVNGAVVGGIRVAVAAVAGAEEVPAWLVAGVSLRVTMRPGDAPGRDPGRTTLHDEGCGDLTTTRILESFSRHFLAWLRRWQDAGFDPVRSAWIARASKLPPALTVGDTALRGTVAGIADDGALQLEADEAIRTVPLATALDAPTWSV